jgi:hypothetical protein
MVCFHSEFHVSGSSLSLVIVTKPKGKNIGRKAMLFYSLQKYNLN